MTISIKTILSNKTARQTILLFSVEILSLVMSFVSNMLIAKPMGVNTFGVYTFAIAILSFLAIFFEFGYFASASRLLAKSNDKEEAQLIGASLFIFSIISILFIITTCGISLFIDYIFDDKIGNILLHTSYISWSFITPFFMSLILKGNNQIKYLSFYNVFWKITFIASLFYIHHLQALSPTNILRALSITCIISFVFFILKLKPSFKNLKTNLIQIQNENKSYGIHMYIGRIISVSTFHLDKLMISFFIGARDVGLYTIANSMANPIKTFSTSLSSSKYKSFSNQKPISKKILLINLLWIFTAIIGANTIGYFIIYHYLGTDYHNSYLLLVIMSIAVASQSLYQPYNAWLSINGYGKDMKKLNAKMAFANLGLNFLFIPFFGAIGAAIASFLSMFYTFKLYFDLYNARKDDYKTLSPNLSL